MRDGAQKPDLVGGARATSGKNQANLGWGRRWIVQLESRPEKPDCTPVSMLFLLCPGRFNRGLDQFESIAQCVFGKVVQGMGENIGDRIGLFRQ